MFHFLPSNLRILAYRHLVDQTLNVVLKMASEFVLALQIILADHLIVDLNAL